MPLGPLQVMIVNFDDANFTGEIEAELVRLQEAGVLRVLDLIVVAKSEDGEIEVVRVSEVHTGALTQAVLGMDGAERAEAAVDDADVWYAADAIAPGSAAAVAVLEHVWAVPLREAIARAGGREPVTEWVDADQLTSLGVTLPEA